MHSVVGDIGIDMGGGGGAVFGKDCCVGVSVNVVFVSCKLEPGAPPPLPLPPMYSGTWEIDTSTGTPTVTRAPTDPEGFVCPLCTGPLVLETAISGTLAYSSALLSCPRLCTKSSALVVFVFRNQHVLSLYWAGIDGGLWGMRARPLSCARGAQ
jgi:hypothetical protein